MYEADTVLEWTDTKSGYRREIHVRDTEADEVIPVPADAPSDAELQISAPLIHVNGIWMPYGDRSTCQKIIWRGKEIGAPFFKPGLIALVNRDLISQFAFLPYPSDCEFTCTWQLDQAAGRYSFQIRWSDSAQSHRRGVQTSTRKMPVHEVAGRLLKSAREASPPHPPVSYEPSYCTWYAFHGTLEQKRVETYAHLARQLGFGCLILDDGWMYDADQRVCGAVGAWHRGNGDYEPSKRKFPDFGACLGGIHSLGMRILLWVAPFLVGQESRSYQKLKGHLLPSWLEEGFLAADPRCPQVVEHLEEKLVPLVERYPLDGFKVDYDYALLGPREEPYGLGAAYADATRRLINSVRRVKAGFEWNLIPNACSVSLTNAFRCSDVPYDPESNRLTMANLKSLIGKAALHYDPSLWHPKDSIETVYRHMVPSLFCVPSLGADIMNLPQEHLEAIRGCLGFCRRHQRVLNQGEFRAEWGGGDYQVFRTALGDEQVLAAFSAYPVNIGQSRNTRVINAGSFRSLTVQTMATARVDLEDMDGRCTSQSSAAGAGIHTIPCPPGSVLRIETE